ncbi:hypothetical protein ACFQDD_00490 [Halorubrum pallidum]|uniref:Halobacterial output domain-containing protein n=1 Tax=Halorubrum pallidum TaxID=1526114 RepID=A0ABD5SY64_9EURY
MVETGGTPPPLAFENLIESSLSAFGVEIAGDMEATEVDSGYEVTVPIDGRLTLADVTEHQGRLLAFKENREIMLCGFEDDRVIVSAKPVANP